MNKIKGNPERLAQLRKLIEQSNSARDAVSDFRRTFAQECAPVKVRDVVTAIGFAFQGKPFEVVRVRLVDLTIPAPGRKLVFGWKAVGNVLKKDGTPGANEAEATWEIEE